MTVISKKPLFAAALVVAGLLVAWFSGVSLAINPSRSMPEGLYLGTAIGTPKVGEIVASCIPEGAAAKVYRRRGYLPSSSRCPSGLAPELKPVVAGPGDMVTVTAMGTWVNGKLIPDSRVFKTDSDGKPIQHLPLGWTVRLAAGHYFLLANHVPRSLDSRYYGPVDRKDIRGRVFPLITD